MWEALNGLPIMVPFALATVVGGIDCTESAAAAGDEYDTRTVLLTEGLASMAAGVCGGVIQNTPYIGQPAYKAMGGRVGYTLATALFIGTAGLCGWFMHLFEWLPEAVAFPILVFVGLEIASQSFHATPSRHFPALVLAILPCLAYLAQLAVDMALAGRPPAPFAAVAMQSLRCLGSGFIVTSLLWASGLAAMLDGKLVRSAGFWAIAGRVYVAGHYPLAAATGGDCTTPPRAGANVRRSGHPLPVALPLGSRLCAGGPAGARIIIVPAAGPPDPRITTFSTSSSIEGLTP